MNNASQLTNIIETHYESFDKDVIQLSHKKPVILDLWAEWCSPCLMIAPVLKQIVNEHNGNLILAKIEVDEGENMKIAGHYKVRGFPTIILIQDGEEKIRFSGAKPKHFIDELIHQHFEI